MPMRVWTTDPDGTEPPSFPDYHRVYQMPVHEFEDHADSLNVERLLLPMEEEGHAEAAIHLAPSRSEERRVGKECRL